MKTYLLLSGALLTPVLAGESFKGQPSDIGNEASVCQAAQPTKQPAPTPQAPAPSKSKEKPREPKPAPPSYLFM